MLEKPVTTGTAPAQRAKGRALEGQLMEAREALLRAEAEIGSLTDALGAALAKVAALEAERKALRDENSRKDFTIEWLIRRRETLDFENARLCNRLSTWGALYPKGVAKVDALEGRRIERLRRHGFW